VASSGKKFKQRDEEACACCLILARLSLHMQSNNMLNAELNRNFIQLYNSESVTETTRTDISVTNTNVNEQAIVIQHTESH
jgi:hypothetical protein